MHVAYSAQQTYKRNAIVSELARALNLDKKEAETFVAPTRASKHELNFRNKLEMGAHMDNGAGNAPYSNWGFMRAPRILWYVPSAVLSERAALKKHPVPFEARCHFCQTTNHLTFIG